ncbi:MAG: TetR/AcrR family transcriptional regulator [Vicinamibacterales bacterium]|nr:TetR/AcrR family transcriptional regulator [Vicinamibacterales bacterium]
MKDPRHDIPRPSAPATPPPDHTARQRLLASAIDIFGRKGYAAASVREIIEQAGVTKPVLYYHFGSKEGLMMAIIQQAAGSVSAVVDRAAADGGTTRERVFRLFAAMRGLVRAHTSELRVVHAVYYFALDLLPTFDYKVFERIILGDLERAIRSGIESGELRNVSPAHASIALGAILGAFLDREMIDQDATIGDGDLLHVLTLVFDGLCPHS